MYMYNKIFRHISLSILFLIPVFIACNSAKSQSIPEVEEGYKSVNGTEIFYKTMGEGEPVIIVHGGPVLEHGYLVPYLKPLTTNYELIFFDQRLSGRSSADVDSTDVTLSNFVEDIEALRKSFGVDTFHLVAHSWGGLLAMKYALKYSSNLRSLALLNSMPASSKLWRKEESILAQKISKEDSTQRHAIMSSDLFKKDPPKAIEKLLILSFKNQFYTPSLADSLDFYIPDDYMTRSRKFGYIRDDISNYDLHAELSSLDIPTLLIYGQIEPATSLSAPRLHDAIPNARLKIIEQSGHFPFLEQPDIFINTVQNFLSTH